jgi:eukaryotic-like serine/threonine-protein kinase
MEPRRIASYTLLEPIGHGGMAVVYRARQDSLERTVAVKILSENLAASPEFMERFRREARTAANLRHPNVITVFDFGEDERGVPYLVLEYIEGPTLADLMDSGLEDDRIPDLFDQIAAGLDYAHARGVIHRDIKPGNVLLTDDGRAVLADFGLAWLLEGTHLTLTGGVIGTPEYMAPEQASGDPIDHRVDVYALGVVLYEMLVGARPFVAETPIAVLLQHLQDTPPSVLEARPDLPTGVGEVIARALAKEPDQRYASAGQLARAFREAFTGATGGSVGQAQAMPPVRGPMAMPPVREATAAPPVRMPEAQRPVSAAPVSSEPVVTPSGSWAFDSRVPSGEQESWFTCPECTERLPFGAGICPACKFMIPLDQLPKSSAARYRIERREVVVNLLPQSIRWSPDGLQLARHLATQALREATVDGWVPASIGEPYRLVEGKTISGSVVESAILKLERVA